MADFRARIAAREMRSLVDRKLLHQVHRQPLHRQHIDLVFGHIYKYYLTQFGKDVIATGLKLKELVLIPRPPFGRVK